MDALSLGYLVKSTFNKVQNIETFNDTTPTSGISTPSQLQQLPPPPPPSNNGGSGIFGLIIFGLFILVFGGYAAYLSWYANTLVHWDTGFKILFSFFAFITGFSYLIGYLIYKMDLVSYIRRSKGEDI